MIRYILKRIGLISGTKVKKNKSTIHLIENDPEIKKIDAEIARLDNRSGLLSSEFVKILKKYGAY